TRSARPSCGPLAAFRVRPRLVLRGAAPSALDAMPDIRRLQQVGRIAGWQRCVSSGPIVVDPRPRSGVAGELLDTHGVDMQGCGGEANVAHLRAALRDVRLVAEELACDEVAVDREA